MPTRTLRWHLGLILLLVGAGGWFGFTLFEKKAWSDYRSRSEARGERFDWEAFIPPELPEAENFASALEALGEEALENLNISRHPKLKNAAFPRDVGWRTAQPIAFRDWFWPREDRRGGAPELSEAEALAAFAAYVESNQATLAALSTAARRPGCRFDADYSAGILMEQATLTKLRDVSRAFMIRGLVALEQGDIGQAAADCESGCLVAKHGDSHTLLIGHLVQIAFIGMTQQVLWEGLRRRIWSDEQLARLDAILAGMNMEERFLGALREERAAFIDMTQGIFIDGTVDVSEVFDIPNGTALRLVPDGFAYRNMRLYAEVLDAYLLDKSGRAVTQLAGEGTERFEKKLMALREWRWGLVPPLHNSLVALAMPMISKTHAGTLQMASMIAMARLAIALERYRLAKAAYPESLEILVPEWIDSVWLDRHAGNEPVKYEIKPDGTPRLYVRGANGLDDGGEIKHNADKGDWVWQYTNPDFDTKAYRD